MRKCSGTSTLRPFTTTSAFGVGSGVSSSTSKVVRSESTEWLDMLGNSFLYGVARFSVPGLSWDTPQRGLHVRATRRCKVSKTHLLPLDRDAGAVWMSAAVRHSRVVGADGSPCSPSSATKFAD